jgi:hypothetical protein
MKISAGILSLLLPVTAIAQNYAGMGGGDTQNMMLQMQKMQTCMQDIDQSRLQEFEQRANKVEAEIKSLCASGKRDTAQQDAIAFGQEVAGNPDVQKMVECGKLMNNVMPRMPFMDQANDTDESAGHVCDQ